MLLRVAVPPIRVHTDCELVLKGFLRGEDWCTAPERRNREIWRQLWAVVKDLGGLDTESVHIIKVKAHATKKERLSMGPQHFIGNGFADKFAKMGVQLNPFPQWFRDYYIGEYKLVMRILEFGAYVNWGSNEVVDTTKANVKQVLAELNADLPSYSQQAAAASQPKASFSEPKGSQEPKFSEPKGSQEGTGIKTKDKAEDKDKAEPQPKAASLTEDQRKLRDLAVKLGHVPIIRNGHAFCKVCSSYAAKGWKKSNLVKQKCTGPSMQVGNLNRLWAGLNPRTGLPFDKVT